MRDMMIMLLAIGMMSPALAAEAPQSGIAGLTAFADAFDAAQIAQDRAALDRMVADDLVFIDGSGKRYGKAFFIDGWTGPDDDYDPVTLTDRIVLPLGSSDERRVGKECVSTCRSRGAPDHINKKKK